MVRIKDGNFIAIFNNRIIEVAAKNEEEAFDKAKKYFETRENKCVEKNNLAVCRIPSMIGILN